MKQIVQNLSDGETSLVELPCPDSLPGTVLIASRRSLVSAGTERMLVEFGKAGYLQKARQQPDKVKQVLDKVRTDGLLTTIESVRSKLDQPLPLGYSNAGIVLESNVEGFSPGDRVVSNGHHAEVVRVGKNLCARIPDSVDDDTAAFTVLAAIGLQGIRLLKPTLGETIVVSGLGLIGLLCVQMLRANGCRVLGIDFDSARCELARRFGAETVDLSRDEDPIAAAQAFSRGQGVDGVLVTASTTSDEVMHQAATICRKRGRIVLVGVVGLNLRRDDFFQKEISFQVSASYGPGRYDPLYEEQGQDYPVGFVRWTEQRNFTAVLDMMASGLIDVGDLISHRFDVNQALDAYRVLGDRATLGILIEYAAEDSALRERKIELAPGGEQRPSARVATSKDPVMAVIGAGNYASRTLIPAFKQAGFRFDTLVTTGSINGVHHGRKAGFGSVSTDVDDVWDNRDIDSVAIPTRHDSHAELVCAALESGKHVFVEKPLCLDLDQLARIEQVQRDASSKAGRIVMVGFNRRFAPLVTRMHALLASRNQPRIVLMTVNAGEIPADHWTQDRTRGGGRIIGEGCHFIDLMRFLVGHSITSFTASRIGNCDGVDVTDDKASITLNFSDGSMGTIHYLANGGKAFPKERVEVFCGNAVLQLDNYRVLRGFGWPGFGSKRLWRQDKGQADCAAAFARAVRETGEAPIPFDEILEVSRITIEVAEALRQDS